MDLIQEMLAQLNKDFDPVELHLHQVPTSSIYFENLVQDLALTIEGLMTNHMEKLLNILYRIDLPEHLTRQCFNYENPALQMSELILKRELQKVVLRKLYSQSPN